MSKNRMADFQSQKASTKQRAPIIPKADTPPTQMVSTISTGSLYNNPSSQYGGNSSKTAAQITHVPSSPTAREKKKGFFSKKLSKKKSNDNLTASPPRTPSPQLSPSKSESDLGRVSVPPPVDRSKEVSEKKLEKQGEVFAKTLSAMMEEAETLTNSAQELREESRGLYGKYISSAFASQTKNVSARVSAIVSALNDISAKLKTLMVNFEKLETNGNPFSERLKNTHSDFFKDHYFGHMNKLMSLRAEFDKAANDKQSSRNATFSSHFGGGQESNDNSGQMEFAVVNMEEMYTHILDETKARHKQLLQLEQSLITCHSLFTELATIVESHGQKLKTIEAAVDATDRNLSLARGELKQGVKMQKKIRKKQIAAGTVAGVGAAGTAVSIANPGMLALA